MAAISARRRIWGWWFFDWASQPYHTLLVTFIFSPFFAGVATEYFMASGLSEVEADARAQSTWSLCLTITGLIIGFGAPFMGALADKTGRRMPYIYAFSVMYVVGSAALWWMAPDGSNMWLMLAFFGLGFIGAEYALIFVNAQLPELGNDEDVGEISGSGFAFGYIGGLVALAILLAFFVEQPDGKTIAGLTPALGMDPEAREGTRFVGPAVALWFLVFMIPYFAWFRETPKVRGEGTVSEALKLVRKSIADLRHRVSLASFLGSSMFYRDALNGLYGFGGVYAKLVLNWQLSSIGIFGIVSGLSAALFCWIGGKVERRVGPKPVICFAICVLILVCLTIVCMSRESLYGIPLAEGSNLPDRIFFGCGMLIGGMGGILQSSSRSLMVRHCDPDAPTEAFGLYGLSGRATAFIAPMLIGIVTTMSGNARIGVSPVIGLFAIGLLLLIWVKAEGDRTR